MAMSFFDQNPHLLGAFREGRRDVLSRVYRTYFRTVERYVHSLCRAAGARDAIHAHALDDLLQDIFIRAFSPNARRAYDGVRPYGPYLSAIARNCFVGAIRAGGREVLKAPDELQRELDDASQPEPICDPRVRTVVASYLEDLPPSLTDVYEQRFVLGHSQDVASQTLGLSRRQLRTEEERLRCGLRRALQRAGVLRHEILEAS
jgi:RNA polymerase sigma-70 factor (ECF subfamily)